MKPETSAHAQGGAKTNVAPSNRDSDANRKTPYTCAITKLLNDTGVTVEAGLTNSDVGRLRNQFGPNQLAEAAPTPTWKKVLAQFRELVIWILIVAAIIAGLLGEWIDTIAILTIVLLNGALGFLQEERANRALAALRAMSSPMAKVIRDGKLISVPATELVPGDIIHLDAGDHVPADSRLLEAYNISAQEASLTGESVPVEKDSSTTLPESTAIGDQTNMVFMGTVITSGKAVALVTATGMQSELGRIAGMLRNENEEPTPLQRRLAELGRILVVVCLVLVGIIFAIQYMRGGPLLETLLVSVSLAVAAVPEGLPAVVTIALALGLQRMVKRNALIRKLPSVETLGSVTVICSDKTGTLTRNEMTVREVIAGGKRWQVSGTGYEPKGELIPGDHESAQLEVSPAEHESGLQRLLTVAAVCNNAKVSLDKHGSTWQVIGDPTEGALIVVAKKAGVNSWHNDHKVLFEIPFDSERKMMSVIVQIKNVAESSPRNFLYAKGAPEIILSRCKFELRNGKPEPISNERRLEIQNQNSDMAKRALRVLGFAYAEDPKQSSGHYQETDLTFLGMTGMIDPPRSEVRDAVAQCHRAGIRPVMITGDHPATALAIGRELNIATPESLAVTGSDLDNYDDDQLIADVDRIAVYARVSAAHKLRVVQAWKKRDHVVAMTGDGVNDAPAVKAADIGIAMGITGTDVTKEAADMVLTDDNFSSIVSAVREGRGIFDNIQKFVHYLLSCNAGEVMLMFVAVVLGMPLPLIAIQILWINLVTDGLPALALALEPPERDIMQRKPRPPREPVMSWQRGAMILYHGVLIAIAGLIGFEWVYANDSQNLAVARSATFAIAAFSQLAFALVCRSQRFTLPELGLFSNRWLFAAFVASTALQLSVMTIPALQNIFGVVPIPIDLWPVIAALSLFPATAIELAKIAQNLLIKRQRSKFEVQSS